MDPNTPNPVESFKNAYFGLLDQTADLVRQRVESAKKIATVSLDAQKQAWSSIANDAAYAPMRNIASTGVGYMELYTKRMSEGMEVAKKATETWTEMALAWQKVALDAQNNAFNAYKSWFSRPTE
jgi:hypothetical protein